jgi:RNA polymerase sigma factor (sigma-70 family)
MTAVLIDEAGGSFEDFYRQQWPGAMRLASFTAGSAAAGEDIVQDVFQRMYLSWGTLIEPAAYLRVAVMNGCRSYHRKRKTEQGALPVLFARDGEMAPTGELDDLVSALPDRQRAVVVMRYWAGYSEAEIADAMGCRAGTVKSLAARAKQRLAVALR